MGFRLAVMIMAHANPITFGKLARALDHPDIGLFCHIDARSNLAPFRREAPHVHFIRDRIANDWGAFTQVEATLNLLRAAMAAGPFGSYALISGDCMPLVPNDQLLDCFRNVPTIVKMKEQFPGDRSFARVTNIYVPSTRIGMLRGHPNHLERHLAPDDLGMIEQALASRAAKARIAFRVFKGHQWLSLSHAHATQILDFLALPSSEDFMLVFRYAAIPDEVFFATALHMVDPGYEPEAGYMGADWSRQPKPFVVRDPAEAPLVFDSRMLFFRKFSDAGQGLIDRVLAMRDAGAAQSDGRRSITARYLRGPRKGGGDQAKDELEDAEDGNP